MTSRIKTSIVALLGFVGFVDAMYLTAERFFALPLPCSTRGCETVLASVYSMIGPIPVSLLGVLYYLTILFLAVHLYTSDDQSSQIPKLLFGITIIGFLMSCYFVFTQIVLIHAICLYCMGSAATSTLLLISSLILLVSFKKNSV